MIHIKKVELALFRNLISTSFSPSPSLNIISGSNGSGKSSLLEALYYIATGSSFRSKRISNIITHENECFTLYAEVASTSSHRIGIKRCRDLNHQTRIDGDDINRRSDLVHILPLQVISPESINLILEGSEVRRNYIDWALFHVEHNFHFHLSHYTKALKQRNALLKGTKLNQLPYWNDILVEHGEVLHRLRSIYVTNLIEPINALLKSLLPGQQVSFGYRSGWSKELSFADALLNSLETDIKLKHTTVGPHRADLIIKCGGIKASEVLSRGQLKLVVIAMKLAQVIEIKSNKDKIPIILIDDIAAELDIEHRAVLLKTILSLKSQIFITTPELELINYAAWDESKVFHVEHGEIKEVV